MALVFKLHYIKEKKKEERKENSLSMGLDRLKPSQDLNIK